MASALYYSKDDVAAFRSPEEIWQWLSLQRFSAILSWQYTSKAWAYPTFPGNPEELIVKTFQIFRSKYILAAMMLLIAHPTFARVNIRQSSDNGTGSNVDSWGLLGRTVVIPLAANGKSVKATRQIICPNQNRAAGSCQNADGSGDYLFLFQIQS